MEDGNGHRSVSVLVFLGHSPNSGCRMILTMQPTCFALTGQSTALSKAEGLPALRPYQTPTQASTSMHEYPMYRGIVMNFNVKSTNVFYSEN